MARFWQFKVVEEVKRSNDEKHFVKLLASKSGWKKLGPESSSRCEEALAQCSPLVKHFLTLAPTVAYKLGLAYANNDGLMYYRVAKPDLAGRLIAKPCTPALALSLELSDAKTEGKKKCSWSKCGDHFVRRSLSGGLRCVPCMTGYSLSWAAQMSTRKVWRLPMGPGVYDLLCEIVGVHPQGFINRYQRRWFLTCISGFKYGVILGI